MSKIIIDNRSSCGDFAVVRMVGNVIGNGKVSGENQYCLATTFGLGLSKYTVEARKSRGDTYSFVVFNEVDGMK